MLWNSITDSKQLLAAKQTYVLVFLFTPFLFSLIVKDKLAKLNSKKIFSFFHSFFSSCLLLFLKKQLFVRSLDNENKK